MSPTVIFYLLGLLAIGVVTMLFAKSLKAGDEQDTVVRRNVVRWGIVMATLWIIYGGIITASSLSK